jgi:predicted ATP-grasp superfamily ATP-dependent carboligase
MYCDAVNLPLPTRREQKYQNAKWIYWRRDFQAALFYWRRGDISLWDWIQSWRGKKAFAVFSWADPVPFFADIFRVVKMLVGGGMNNRAVRSKALFEAAGEASGGPKVN